MYQWGANRRAIKRAYPDSKSPLTPKLEGIERPPFQIPAKLLEIDENVNRTRLVRYFLALNLCLEQQLYSFH